MIKEYKDDSQHVHMFYNPTSYNWIGLYHGALTIDPEGSPEAPLLELEFLVDPAFLFSSDVEILQLSGLWNEKWRYLAEELEEDRHLTDEQIWPLIKRHMCNYLRGHDIVVGDNDTPFVRVFRQYAIELCQTGIKTAIAQQKSQRCHHCMCGASNFSRNTWHMDEGEVDALECTKCHAGAPLESWLNYWGIEV
jgi:hypothetical protein